jgi:hypothetical protein
MIESLNLPTAQEQCMKDVIGGYTNDDLENIASDNDGLAFNTEDYIAAGTPEFQEYVERLQACREGDRDGRATEQGGPTTPGAGEATDATDAADAADAAEATEAVNDTTPAAETTAD